MRTRRSSSIAWSRASDLLTLRCVVIASVICLPTRIVGLSERAGSWNTIAISLPRCLRSWPSDRPISSVPRSRAEPLISAPTGSRPIMARQPTVLPEPDSPMMARVRPSSTL